MRNFRREFEQMRVAIMLDKTIKVCIHYDLSEIESIIGLLLDLCCEV